MIAQRLAEFITGTTIKQFSSDVIDYAKMLTLSFLGSTIAGAVEPASDILTQYIKTEGGSPEAGVIGKGFLTSASQAALATGTFSHASELEDNSFPDALATFRVIAASLAVGHKVKASGAEILESIVVGHEIGGRLLRACVAMRQRGFSGSVMGTLGVSASAAKLLKLDVGRTAMALSLAAGHTQGLSRQSGSMAHFYDMGLCARNGTVAALLAQGGFTGSPSIIEDSPGGLCYAFAGEGKYNLEEMMNSLGKPPLCIMSVGIKKYACCWEEHRIIDSLVELKDKQQIAYKDLENMEVHVGPFFSRFVRYSEPANVEESRFSIEHSLASVFLENDVVYNLEIYGDEKKVLSPQYAEARQKVSVVHHPEREFSAMGGADQIIVKLKNGKEFKCECETARGVPPAYLSEEDVKKKFRNCIEYSKFLTKDQVSFVEENVSRLEEIKNTKKLLDLVTYGKKKQKKAKR